MNGDEPARVLALAEARLQHHLVPGARRGSATGSTQLAMLASPTSTLATLG